MFLDLIIGIFTMANSFIALFIVIYALLFLKKTKSHKERRPWDYLFVASIIYLCFTMLLMMLEIYDMKLLFNLDVYELSIFFQFIYTGLILLAFISQTDLIFKNELIIITRKVYPEDKQEQIENSTKEFIKREEQKIAKEVEDKVEQEVEAKVLEDVQTAIPQAPAAPKAVAKMRVVKKKVSKPKKKAKGKNKK